MASAKCFAILKRFTTRPTLSAISSLRKIFFLRRATCCRMASSSFSVACNNSSRFRLRSSANKGLKQATSRSWGYSAVCISTRFC